MSDIDSKIEQILHENMANEEEVPTKKPSVFARFKNIFIPQKKEKDEIKDSLEKIENQKKVIEAKKGADILSKYLEHIETQLDKVDEQNKLLIDHLATAKENNEAFINQITALSKTNEKLSEQFSSLKRREKVAKIIAIIASSLAIGFWVFQFIRIIVG
ncbi:MAG: hypothetical protein FWE22_02565 [Firmicutes bacterium]|nr:hypothetical protein [Bacillota bacterium]